MARVAASGSRLICRSPNWQKFCKSTRGLCPVGNGAWFAREVRLPRGGCGPVRRSERRSTPRCWRERPRPIPPERAEPRGLRPRGSDWRKFLSRRRAPAYRSACTDRREWWPHGLTFPVPFVVSPPAGLVRGPARQIPDYSMPFGPELYRSPGPSITPEPPEQKRYGLSSTQGARRIALRASPHVNEPAMRRLSSGTAARSPSSSTGRPGGRSSSARPGPSYAEPSATTPSRATCPRERSHHGPSSGGCRAGRPSPGSDFLPMPPRYWRSSTSVAPAKRSFTGTGRDGRHDARFRLSVCVPRSPG